jgi:hypothetical protein
MSLNQLTPPYVRIDYAQPASRSRELGFAAFDSGTISLNTFITNASGQPVPFHYLYITVGGTLKVEKVDGTISTTTPPSQVFWPVAGFRVLTDTTATGITWFGGLGGYNP